jgi:hypothetical protein
MLAAPKRYTHLPAAGRFPEILDGFSGWDRNRLGERNSRIWDVAKSFNGAHSMRPA